MAESHDVVVIGAGHAGLTTGWTLTERGVEHVVMERDRVAERWRTAPAPDTTTTLAVP